MREQDRVARPRRLKRLAQLTVAFLVLLVVSGIAIRAHTTRAMERELQAIRDRGLPTSPQEVNAWYASVPANENSALVILKAHDFYVEAGANDPKDLSKGLVLGETLPPKLAGAIAGLVERNGKALAELHRASQLPKSRYPVDLNPGLASLLPHLTRVKAMAELLKWEAIYHSARGDRTNAVRAIESGFGVAASLKDEPIDISALVRISCLWMALSALERVVTEQQLSESEIDRLLVLARSGEEHSLPSLKRAFLGERGLTLPVFNMTYRELCASAGITNSSVEWREAASMIRSETRCLFRGHRRDPFVYLSHMGEVEAALEMDVAEMVREAERIDGAESSTILLCFSEADFFESVLPKFSRATTKTALLIAQLRCISLALEVEKVRLKNEGQIPSTEELANHLPQRPKDPIDNQPITFELLEKGYQVSARAATELKKKRAAGVTPSFVPIAFRVLR
jgi:hypothetical protein